MLSLRARVRSCEVVGAVENLQGCGIRIDVLTMVVSGLPFRMLFYNTKLVSAVVNQQHVDSRLLFPSPVYMRFPGRHSARLPLSPLLVISHCSLTQTTARPLLVNYSYATDFFW